MKGFVVKVMIVGGLLLSFSAENAQAQCGGGSGRRPMMSQSAMQQYLMQQRYALLQNQALQQMRSQQSAQQQQLANNAPLKKKTSPPKVAKESELQTSPAVQVEDPPIDPEQAAASSLKLAKTLAASPDKVAFAKMQLRRIVDTYPNTGAATEAGELLTHLK
jgi:hypothetical protein